MTRWWGCGTALLIAALLPGACTEKVVLEHPEGGSGGGGGTTGLGGGAGGGGTGFGDGGSSDAATDSRLHCVSGQPITVNVSPETPSIMFAVDRSPSMRFTLDGMTARYLVTREAISATLGAYQSLAAFGYVEFPAQSNDSSCNDCCAGGFVPLISPNNMNNASNAILSQMSQCWNPSNQQYNCIGSNESPSAQALKRIANTFRNTPTSGGQFYALLLTDGQPSCVLDQQSPDNVCDQTAQQISDMSLGPPKIGTFVVTVGDPAPDTSGFNECLSTMASAGGHASGQQRPFYYVANTESLVHSQIDHIVASTICHLDINSQTAFDQNTSRIAVDVTINNTTMTIANMDPTTNGYTLAAGGTRIDFAGTAPGQACNLVNGALLKGGHRITVRACPDPHTSPFQQPNP